MFCLNKFIKFRYDINEAKEVKPFRIILISRISIDRPVCRKFDGIIEELRLLLT